MASQLIQNRRSIFPNMYTGEIVDDSIIEKMLENANWAPTHKFTAPWRFVVFKGEGLKQLAEFQSDLYKKITVSKGRFDPKKFEMLRTKPLKASHVIAIGMKRDEKERIPEIEEIEAVACSVQNMHLTATAHGIGCYWGTGGVTYINQANSFFGLSERDKLLGFFFIGRPRKWPKGKRKPLDNKVTWVR
ncbi:nitroreductase [Bacteroidota bacterium]